jgi:hypothetical protein
MPIPSIARRGAFVALCLLAVLGVARTPGGKAAPQPSAGATVTIVDWAGNYVDTDTSMDRYITVEYPVDLDGGNDDARAYVPYSDSAPINPKPEGGNAYGGTYATGTSYRFYGAVLFQHYGGNFGSKWAEVWERPSGFDRIYESADATSDGWALFYWKKPDFLNGASAATIVFDAASSLEVLNYAGADGVIDNNSGRIRFVVRDGAQFYLSEDYADKQTSSGFTLTNLTARRWAAYSPAPPYDIKFDSATAVFAPHQFSDITAVGLYHSNDQASGVTRRAGLNFERFRVKAAIQGSPPTDTPTATQMPTPPLNKRRFLPVTVRS